MALIVLFIILGYVLEGPHQMHINDFKADILWCAYWIGLGVLSSVGLGTGLHTFILYLVSRSLCSIKQETYRA